MADFAGNEGDNIFTGGVDNDTAKGNGGNDTLSGNGGNDVLEGNAGADALDGGEGADTLYSGDKSPPYTRPYYGNPWVAPLLDTGSEFDILRGGADGDTIFAGYGDTVDGGTGHDTLLISFLGAPTGITVDFRQAAGTGSVTVGGATISSIEALAWIEGSNFDDVITDSDASANFAPIFGRGGNDKIYGGYYTGNIYGGDGDDLIDRGSSPYGFQHFGEAGNDVLIGSYNGELLDGGDGNDELYGNGGFDDLFGGAGEDVLDGGSSDDDLYGGNDNDSLYGGASGDFMDGGAGDDTLYGDSTSSAASSYGGDDVIIGGTGADILHGEQGNDRLWSGAAAATHYEGGLDDVGLERDQLFGGDGNDTMSIGYGDDADGGAGSDTLRISLAGSPTGLFFNTADFSPGASWSLFGGTIVNVEALSAIVGSDHADRITIATHPFGITVVAGGGDDIVTSNGSSVFLYGGAGSDRLISGIAADIFNGGDGIDTIDYINAVAGVTVALAAVGQTGTGPGGDQLTNVENIGGSAFGDTLGGNGAANVIDGMGGNDTIDGGAAADWMAGGAGDDVFLVDDAGDTVSESAGEGTDEIQTALASYTLPAHVEVLTYTGSGDFTATGSTSSDTITGGSGHDTIHGMDGGDTLMLQRGGDDTATGGAGNDGFYMGGALTGLDDLDGGDGYDQLGLQGSYADYTFSESNLRNTEMIVLMSGTDARFGDSGGSLYSYDLTTIDANVAAGQQLYLNFNMLQAGENVVFDGSAETDGHFRTSGGLGNDILTGGAQDDGFYFGAQGRWGAGDKVNGGPGGTMDQLGLHGLYAGATAISFAADQLIGIEMIVLLTGGDTRFGSGGLGYSYDLTMHDGNVAAGGLMYVSANTLRADETLTFDGTAETDGRFTIYGGEANDTITGGAGADILSGRGGADMLRGGAGEDVFLYGAADHSTPAARDTILDFAFGDKIDLSRIDAVAGGGDDSFTFVGAAAFTGTAGELRAVRNGPEWIVEGDLDGDGVADFAFSLYRVDGLGTTAADFIL